MKLTVTLPLLALLAGANAQDKPSVNLGEGGLVEMAKDLLGDAMGFVKKVADSTVDMTRTTLEELTSDTSKLAEFMGARGVSFNADDLLDKSFLENLKDSQTLDQIYDVLEDAVADHCHAAEFKPSEKVNSKCVGPKVELELKPKTCKIDASGHSIDCEPAKLVMKKKPAKCTYKHHSAVEWKSDWCAIEKLHGVLTNVTKGGDEYTKTVGSLKNGSIWEL
jgi:hypothetical protein